MGSKVRPRRGEGILIMQNVIVSETIRVAGCELLAGVGYLLPSTVTGSLLTDHRLVKCEDGIERPAYRLVDVWPAAMKPISPTNDYNGRRVWMFRSGGYGDWLMITPTIREIHRRWPECEVHVCTLPKYTSLFRGMKGVVAHGGWLEDKWIALEDACIFFEGVIEDSLDAREMHGAWLFAQRAGFGPETYCNMDIEPMYRIFNAELGWARAKYPRGKKPRVGVQVGASSAVRSYPPDLLVEVIKLLAAKYEVFLFAEPGKLDCDLPGVRNLAEDKLDFRQSVAVLSTCDVALVPDSSLLHICGALQIPYVGIFGSFNPRLRMVRGPRLPLEGTGLCAPCFYHGNGGKHFPDHRPCGLAGFCTVIAGISPDIIVGAVEKLWTFLENKKNKAQSDGHECPSSIPKTVFSLNKMKEHLRADSVLLAMAGLSLFGLLFLTGCSSSPEATEVAAKYTEQTAQAIIEGSWHIAASLFLGLILNGIFR